MQWSNIIEHISKKHPDVTIVAVTKNSSPESIIPLLRNGITHLAESRISHATEIFSSLWEYSYTKHFIGSVQSRKTKTIVSMFDVIQSVDSYKVAKDISIHASWLGKQVQIFLQLNLTGESKKSGFTLNSPDEIEQFSTEFEDILGLPNIEVTGLMCMWKKDDPDTTRQVFMRLASLKNQLQLPCASMWMSEDYTLALECGSNMIRLGTILGLTTKL